MESKRLYYSIGEVSELFDIPASTIRFWEKEFTLLKPKKNNKGNRLFTEKDIENLRVIYNLVKENGYTLAGAKAHLKETKKEISENSEILKKLQKIKQQLENLKASLE